MPLPTIAHAPARAWAAPGKFSLNGGGVAWEGSPPALAVTKCVKSLTIFLEPAAVQTRAINAILTAGSVRVSVSREWSDDTGSLKRFGLALARDDRFVLDDASAVRLVEKLVRQTCVAAVTESFVSRLEGRARAFARFIHLYRRHIRRLALDDGDGHWVDGGSPRGGPPIANGVRALPLELREALLLVVLAAFSHEEAAQALDVPLSRLLERLDRARARLEEQMAEASDGARGSTWVGAPHLRIIK
jgi:hypothetical protein